MLSKIAVVLALFLFPLFTPNKVAAAPFLEDFSNPLTFKDPGDPQRPGLWLINSGDFHNGAFQYYRHCGDSSCIHIEKEGNGPAKTEYLSLVMSIDTTPGNYVNMEASELQTGYAFGQGYEDTHPTPGHPVTVSARMRCSSCNFDGSGGQVGSWGLWLWNSYPQILPGGGSGLNPITAIGFGWVQQGEFIPGGLNITVYQDSFPLYFTPLSYTMAPLDLTQWHTYSFTWSADGSGTESVVYYIDGNQVGDTIIPGSLPPLSQTLWHDNQLVTGFDEFGSPISSFINPDSPQSVDVDFVSVSQ